MCRSKRHFALSCHTTINEVIISFLLQFLFFIHPKVWSFESFHAEVNFASKKLQPSHISNELVFSGAAFFLLCGWHSQRNPMYHNHVGMITADHTQIILKTDSAPQRLKGPAQLWSMFTQISCIDCARMHSNAYNINM